MQSEVKAAEGGKVYRREDEGLQALSLEHTRDAVLAVTYQEAPRMMVRHSSDTGRLTCRFCP